MLLTLNITLQSVSKPITEQIRNQLKNPKNFDLLAQKVHSEQKQTKISQGKQPVVSQKVIPNVQNEPPNVNASFDEDHCFSFIEKITAVPPTQETNKKITSPEIKENEFQVNKKNPRTHSPKVAVKTGNQTLSPIQEIIPQCNIPNELSSSQKKDIPKQESTTNPAENIVQKEKNSSSDHDISEEQSQENHSEDLSEKQGQNSTSDNEKQVQNSISDNEKQGKNLTSDNEKQGKNPTSDNEKQNETDKVTQPNSTTIKKDSSSENKSDIEKNLFQRKHF